MIYRILFYNIVGFQYFEAITKSDSELMLNAHIWSFICLVLFAPIFPYNNNKKKEDK